MQANFNPNGSILDLTLKAKEYNFLLKEYALFKKNQLG